LDRIVAIKVLPETLADDAQFRERFDREARTISQLDHPNICTLYDVGNQDGVSFLVMQFLEGETLDARLKTRAPSEALPLDESLRIAIQIADALDKAHRAGVVHRDLKPANIFLARTSAFAPPVAKLLDFGLAKTGVPAVSNASGAVVPTALPTTPVNITAQAYQAAENQSARPEVFVRPLSDGTVKYQVSAGGGAYPRWRGDGRELFFLESVGGGPGAAGGRLMAVDIGSSQTTFERGTPHPLFDSLYIPFQHTPGVSYHAYAVSRDGQRFLLPRVVQPGMTEESSADAPVVVVLNWASTLKK
jgi:serine/threonine protein kinase